MEPSFPARIHTGAPRSRRIAFSRLERCPEVIQAQHRCRLCRSVSCPLHHPLSSPLPPPTAAIVPYTPFFFHIPPSHKQCLTTLIARCNSLRCPGLALKVFSNRPKYGFDLSLDAAQIILHSLHRWQRHKDIITFTTLYSIYNLPPVASDLVSNALLLKALLRKPTNPSAAMAQAMLPLLQRSLERTDPLSMVIQQEDPRLSNKKKTWLAFALKRIEGALQAQQVEHGWLTRWMQDSGHSSATASI